MAAFLINRSPLAIAALLGLLVAGCGESPTPGPAAQPETTITGHQRMIDSLETIRQQSLTNDEYFEEASIRAAKRMLREADADNLQLHFDVNWQLGNHLLRLGQPREAVAHLEAAWKLTPEDRKEVGDEKVKLLLRDLGVACLRLGETENCVHCLTGESCVLPIQPGGVHQHKDGSSMAVDYFRLLLKEDPQQLDARWLLNIAHMTLGQYPDGVDQQYLIPPTAFDDGQKFPRFKNIAADLKLDEVECSGGAVAEDFDNDGDIDLLTSNWDRAGRLRYYENNNGKFEERGEEGGLSGLFGGLNMVQADYDNDGDTDVLVLRGAWLTPPTGDHPNSLLQNDGKGNFVDVAFDCGLAESNHPTQTAAWADYDNDGDLDLYVGNENVPCQLFRNDGQGQFEDVAKAAGVGNFRFTKAVVWGDFDNDDDPDLYVSNLGQPNRLYRNEGDGKFVDVAKELTVGAPIQSFPAWFWDFNNDGNLDLYVSSYHAHVKHIAEDFLSQPRTDKPDCVYQGNGGSFKEVATQLGLTQATQPMGCNFGDLDNDGFPDFLLGTGYVDYSGLMPNLMFRNVDGNGFANVTFSGGFGHLQKGHGVAWADFDRDGDLDIFAQMGGANPGDAFGNVLYENPGFENHWLSVKLVGKQSNRSAIGARICATIEYGDQQRTVYRWVNSGGSFGANPLQQHIGLGKANQIKSLQIHWPTTGKTQLFENIAADQHIEIHEDQDSLQ